MRQPSGQWEIGQGTRKLCLLQKQVFCDCLPHVFKLHFFLFNSSTAAVGLREGKREGKGMLQEWGNLFIYIFFPFFYPSIFYSINPVWCDFCQMQMSQPDMVGPEGTSTTRSTAKLIYGVRWCVCVCVFEHMCMFDGLTLTYLQLQNKFSKTIIAERTVKDMKYAGVSVWTCSPVNGFLNEGFNKLLPTQDPNWLRYILFLGFYLQEILIPPKIGMISSYVLELKFSFVLFRIGQFVASIEKKWYC